MPSLSDSVSEAVTEAIETYRAEQEGGHHGVPSPSGVASCRLQQWFNGRGYPRSNPVPAASVKKMQSGTLIESFWRDIYNRAGFAWSPLPQLAGKAGPFAAGQGDGRLTVVQPTLPWPIGTQLLLELKDLGVWTYFDAIDKGLKDGLPDYYAQVQVYMGLYDFRQAIFHAGQADASSVTYVWRRIKRREGSPPAFHAEVVDFDAEHYSRMLDRAEDVSHHLDPVRVPHIPLHLRDYDVFKLAPADKYPCGYCSWQKTCLDAGK